MVEGDSVFKEAIAFLKSLFPLKPLQWDENLAHSAQKHVDDVVQRTTSISKIRWNRAGR